MFKQNWERWNENIKLPSDYDSLEVVRCQGGCMNYNYRVVAKGRTLLLRVNNRKPSLAKLEYLIERKLRGVLPIPELYEVGEGYSVQQFVEGVLLSQVVQDEPERSWLPAIRQAGQAVGVLQGIKFEFMGFFDENLQPQKANSPHPLWDFAQEMLENANVRKALGDLHVHLYGVVHDYKELITEPFEATFVHGDFDPSNIIVQKCRGKWRIAAIIDWEFASAGYWLWDVGNMLRYAHKLPKSYEGEFLGGVLESLELPSNWRQQCIIHNILALLDILSRDDPVLRPVATKDIYGLLSHFMAAMALLTKSQQ